MLACYVPVLTLSAGKSNYSSFPLFKLLISMCPWVLCTQETITFTRFRPLQQNCKNIPPYTKLRVVTRGKLSYVVSVVYSWWSYTHTHRDIANYFLSLWLDTHFLHTGTTVMEQSWYAWSAATACSCFMLQVKSKYDVKFLDKFCCSVDINSLCWSAGRHSA